jgi:oligopeptide/dipeptide ABC transporter ATP-binding protein
MDQVIIVKDLVKNFPIRGTKDVVHAVSHVSFEVGCGETLGLVGESGSGKTTTGRCLLKLIEPTSGQIIFKGTDITKVKQKEFIPFRSRIQLVFQEPYDSVNPRMTVGKIIEENMYLESRLGKSERIARVDELLEMVGLDKHLAEVFPHELTGGEQQRVGIARAISTNPDLIVLDEITSSLDITVRAGIIRLLMRLQDEIGMSYIFISHDITAVREISHRVAVMYLGEIVEVGDNPEIFNNQYHPYSKALLSSVLYPDPELTYGEVKLVGEIPSPVNPPSGCYLHPRCPFVIDMCKVNHPNLQPVDILDNEKSAARLMSCWRGNELFNG